MNQSYICAFSGIINFFIDFCYSQRFLKYILEDISQSYATQSYMALIIFIIFTDHLPQNKQAYKKPVAATLNARFRLSNEISASGRTSGFLKLIKKNQYKVRKVEEERTMLKRFPPLQTAVQDDCCLNNERSLISIIKMPFGQHFNLFTICNLNFTITSKIHHLRLFPIKKPCSDPLTRNHILQQMMA